MENEVKRQKAKPLPTLLTKSDAMLFAADNLEAHISNLELAAIFADVFAKKPLEAEDEKGLEELDDIPSMPPMIAGMLSRHFIGPASSPEARDGAAPSAKSARVPSPAATVSDIRGGG